VNEEVGIFTEGSKDNALVVEKQCFGVVLVFEGVVALMASIEGFERRLGAEDGARAGCRPVDGRKRPAVEQPIAVALLLGEGLHLSIGDVLLQLAQTVFDETLRLRVECYTAAYVTETFIRELAI